MQRREEGDRERSVSNCSSRRTVEGPEKPSYGQKRRQYKNWKYSSRRTIEEAEKTSWVSK